MNKTKILVIDDEKGLREMLVYSLSSRGYAVTTAENGREGVEKARAERFDLALCDLMMPEMGGIETLQRLTRKLRLTDLPRRKRSELFCPENSA